MYEAHMYRSFIGVHLADGVTVQAGAVLGQDGFGFDSDAAGHHHLPHYGGVQVGAGALIGAITALHSYGVCKQVMCVCLHSSVLVCGASSRP